MKQFTGSWSNRLPVFCLLAMSAALIFIGLLPVAASPNNALPWRILLLLMGGGMGLFSLYSLLETFTVYQVDETQIVRRAWNGTRELRWSQIVRCRVSSQKNATFALFDEQGQKLSVALSLLGSKKQTELRALLEMHLTPVRERQLRDLGSVPQVYHPSRFSANCLLVASVLIGVMLAGCVLMPQRPGEQGLRVFACAFIALFELACLYGTAYFYARTLTVTPHELTEKTLFREKQIPLHHVTSVHSREIHDKNTTWEITLVEGDGQSIRISSRTQDYDLLIQYIRSQISPQAIQEGDAKTEEIRREEARKARAQAPYVVAFIFCVFGGMGFWTVRQSQAKLETYRLIDTRGRGINGQVTGVHTTTGKNTHYFLDFVFYAEGQRIESASPVSSNDYQKAYKGAPVTVLYVPEQPRLCRAAQSIGKSQAQGGLWIGYLNIVLGYVVVPADFFWRLHKRKTSAH